MNIYYALYDASFNMGDGHYWTWKSNEIPLPLLEQVYYDARKLNPPDLAALQDGLTCGGFVLLKDWLVAYRYYNGGRDLQNRPGRVVVLTGWIPRNDQYGETILDIYHWGLFEELAKSTPPCPVPKPDLNVNCSGRHLKLGNGKRLWSSIQNDPAFEFPPKMKLNDVIQAMLELPSEAENLHLSILDPVQFKIQKIITEVFTPKKDNTFSNPVSIPVNEEPSYSEEIYEMNTETPSHVNQFNTFCYLAGIFILAGMCLFLLVKPYFQTQMPVSELPKEEMKNLYDTYLKSLEKDWKEYTQKGMTQEDFLKKHPELLSWKLGLDESSKSKSQSGQTSEQKSDSGKEAESGKPTKKSSPFSPMKKNHDKGEVEEEE